MVEDTAPEKRGQIEIVGLQLVYRFFKFALTTDIVFMITRLTRQVLSEGRQGASVSELPQRPERTTLLMVGTLL